MLTAISVKPNANAAMVTDSGNTDWILLLHTAKQLQPVFILQQQTTAAPPRASAWMLITLFIDAISVLPISMKQSAFLALSEWVCVHICVSPSFCLSPLHAFIFFSFPIYISLPHFHSFLTCHTSLSHVLSAVYWIPHRISPIVFSTSLYTVYTVHSALSSLFLPLLNTETHTYSTQIICSVQSIWPHTACWVMYKPWLYLME